MKIDITPVYGEIKIETRTIVDEKGQGVECRSVTYDLTGKVVDTGPWEDIGARML